MSVKTCFIVTQIGSPGSPENEHANKVLKYLIQPVCDELDYLAIRVDKESINGNINERIINHLKNDDIVIADMTGHNPNAFFELGYRQALGLPLVPIIEASQSLPFDVIAENTVFYDTDVSKIDESKNRLKNMLLDYKDFIMPNKRPKNIPEFDKINDKLDEIIKNTSLLKNNFSNTRTSSVDIPEITVRNLFSTNPLNITSEDLSRIRTSSITSVSEKIQSQTRTPEDKK